MPLLMLKVLLVSGLVAAQAPPACTATGEGSVACLGDRLCQCRWSPGGSLTGRPAGYRWDCGVLRPHCGVVPPGPDPSGMQFLLPWPGGGSNVTR